MESQDLHTLLDISIATIMDNRLTSFETLRGLTDLHWKEDAVKPWRALKERPAQRFRYVFTQFPYLSAIQALYATFGD
jgi:hypothetical protein